MKHYFLDLVALVLIGSALVVALGLAGCKADIGHDDAKSLQTENTNLKLQLQQKTIEAKTYWESAASTQRALDTCYKSKP